MFPFSLRSRFYSIEDDRVMVWVVEGWGEKGVLPKWGSGGGWRKPSQIQKGVLILGARRVGVERTGRNEVKKKRRVRKKGKYLYCAPPECFAHSLC